MNADVEELFRYNRASAHAAADTCERHQRQTYFGKRLPCATCATYLVLLVNVPDEIIGAIPGDAYGWGSRVCLLFERTPPRWVPIPCIDRTVNPRLTEALLAEGLEGAFV